MAFRLVAPLVLMTSNSLRLRSLATTPLCSSLLESVHSHSNTLYPSTAWRERATSCPDRFISGRTYGEFTEYFEGLTFFETLVSRCIELHQQKKGAVPLSFADLGSGTGRVVLEASMLWPTTLRACRGIEASKYLHEGALDAHNRHLTSLLGGEATSQDLCCEFTHASFEDPAAREILAETDIAFAYSTAFPSTSSNGMEWLVKHLQPLPIGSLVVTIDNPLLAPSLSTGQGSSGFVLKERVRGQATYGAPGLNAEAHIYERTSALLP